MKIEKKSQLLKGFNKVKIANEEGYIGCMPNGELVDRREQPKAFPVAANKMFGITEPRCISCNNPKPIMEIINSLCTSCRSTQKQ